MYYGGGFAFEADMDKDVRWDWSIKRQRVYF